MIKYDVTETRKYLVKTLHYEVVLTIVLIGPNTPKIHMPVADIYIYVPDMPITGVTHAGSDGNNYRLY